MQVSTPSVNRANIALDRLAEVINVLHAAECDMNEPAITDAARQVAQPLMQMFDKSADTHLGNIHNATVVNITPLSNMTDALQRLAPLTRELTQCEYEEARKALREPIPVHFVIGASGSRPLMAVSVCAMPDSVKHDSRSLEDGKKDGAPEYKNDDDDGDGDSMGVRLASGKSAAIALAVACLVSMSLL